MPNYLTAQQVKQQFGLSRNQLLRYEAAGLLGNIERTPGGQRRYNGSAISNLINNKNQAVAEVPQKYYSDFGTTGLNRWNGHIDQSDELRELRGSSGIKIYREMRKNDPVISAIFFAIENSLKQANKRIKASTEKSIDKQAAEFVESCHPGGTLIRTAGYEYKMGRFYDALVPIENITVGTKVITHNGLIQTVIKTMNREYSGNIYTFKRLYSYEDISCTENHPLLIRKKGVIRHIKDNKDYKMSNHVRTGDYKWIEACNVNIGDSLVEPIDFSIWNKEFIDISEYKSKYMDARGWYNGQNTTIEINEDFCELIGFYIAEGSISNNSLSITLNKNEHEIAERLEKISRNLLGNISTSIIEVKDAEAIRLYIYSSIFMKFIKDNFYKNNEKIIPQWFFHLPNNKVTKFLYAHSVGDGYFNRLSISITIQNKFLADTIRRMYLRIGIIPSISRSEARTCKILNKKTGNKKDINTKESYTLYLIGENARKFSKLANFKLDFPIRKTKHSKCFISNGMAHYEITDININNAENIIVYNMEVNKDHSFLANNIASHNCLSDMSYAWSDTMDFACQMLEVGVSPLEISYKRRLGQNPPKYVSDPGTSKYSDGRVGWRKWSPRPIESLAVNDEWIFDDNGNLQGLNQVDEDGKKIAIPISKLLIFRTTAAPYNSPQSDPIHRAAYTSYYYSKNFQEIEGIGVERDLNGIPIVYLGNDCTKEDFTIAKDLVVNMRVDEQAGIVVPHAKMGYAPEGQGMLVELLSSFNSRSHNVDDIITRYDKRKALSVLTQFIMLGMDKYGSFALSKTQNDLFVLAISAWLQKIADVINMYAIPRLINYNVFPGMTGMPEIAFNEAGIPDLSAMATFVNSMVGNEVIHPDAELERHLRQMARLPDPVPVDVNKPGGNLKPKPIAETALIIRRIILALKELPSYSTMSDESLMAMLEPMVAQMQQGIELETGVKIPNVTGDISGDEKQLRSDIEQIWQQLIKEGIV